MDKFEQEIYQKMQTNENFLKKLSSAFLGSKSKGSYSKAYKKAVKLARRDPELRAALAGLDNYQERLARIIDNLCKRNTTHPACTDKK